MLPHMQDTVLGRTARQSLMPHVIGLWYRSGAVGPWQGGGIDSVLLGAARASRRPTVASSPRWAAADVTKVFEKRHDHVLRDIDALLTTSPNLGTCGWFREVQSQVAGGNGALLQVRSFDMTRDGFSLLVMAGPASAALARASFLRTR